MVQLRDAVALGRVGLPYDDDPVAPSVQPPPAPTRTRPAQPGRLVRRAEKRSDELDAWLRQWAGADESRLARLAQALEAEGRGARQFGLLRV